MLRRLLKLQSPLQVVKRLEKAEDREKKRKLGVSDVTKPEYKSAPRALKTRFQVRNRLYNHVK